MEILARMERPMAAVMQRPLLVLVLVVLVVLVWSPRT